MESKMKVAIVGCGFVLLRATLIWPLWAYLLCNLLRLSGAGDFVWFVFWAYVGLQWLSYVAEGVISMLLKTTFD